MEKHPWKLMLVDDDPDDYALTRAWLAEALGDQFDLQWKPTRASALKALHEEAYDAVLVDYDLGGSSGLDLIREALKQGMEVPFIMVTGRGDYDVDVEAMRVGAVDFLSKNDATPFLLERSIRYAIERKRAEIALREARDKMEQRVRERTQELRQANQDLSQANEQIRQYAERSMALADLSQVLAEAGTNYPSLLEIFARRVGELIGQTATISLLSVDSQHLNIAASYCPDTEASVRIKEKTDPSAIFLEDGLANQVVKTGQPILIPNDQDPGLAGRLQPVTRVHLEQAGIGAVLIVPLRVQNRVIGTLSTTRFKSGNPYTPEDQAFMQSLADRAAVAIENARLFDALHVELAERKRAEVGREEAERAIRSSEARFRAIFEGSAIGIELRDLRGRILAANPALEGMLGYTGEELCQLSDLDITHPEDRAANIALYATLVNGSVEGYRTEKRYLHKDGSLLWARLAASLVRDPYHNPQFSVAMIENISERKEMEARLAEVRRRLVHSRESERLALAQELHDGPVQELYGIDYSIAAMLAESSGGEKDQDLLQVKEKVESVIRVLRVISGELRPPTLAPFGLEKTIRSHGETFQLEHPEITLILDLQPDGQALPESTRMALFRIYQQALVNIVRHAKANRVSVSFHFDDLRAWLAVQDDGAGFTVPEEWIDYVRGGHFGLAGSAERAEAVGGSLKVISQPGKGTRLYVEVPRQEGDPGSLTGQKQVVSRH